VNAVYRHLVVCFLTGLVAILPVGGTILLVVLAERSLSPLAPGAFYFASVRSEKTKYAGSRVLLQISRWLFYFGGLDPSDQSFGSLHHVPILASSGRITESR